MRNPVSEYGFTKQDNGSIVCDHCAKSFPRPEGSVMRGHRRRCEVHTYDHHTPGVCDA
jgi:hypothetical protein